MRRLVWPVISTAVLVVASVPACGAGSGGRVATGAGPDTATHDATGEGGPSDPTTPGAGTSGGSTADTDAAVGIRRRELAGHTRSDDPGFAWVQDFDDGVSIELAIDASTLPELVGSTCDVWITSARSIAAWQQDATLVDVRAGGPQALVVEPTLTRAPIAAPGELSSAAGPSVGVAYDIVLDCNRNGSLDDGDVLDGGDAPGLYRVHDLVAAGPLAVASFEAYAGVFLDQRVFHPADLVDGDPRPLVVVTHGWSYNHTYYDYIGEHLASYGYIVVLHEADVQDGGPEATLAAARTTLENTDDVLVNQATIGGGVLDGHIDARRIMFTGHSTGGEAVVRALTQLREGSYVPLAFGYDDVRVVSSMAPVSWHDRAMVDPGDVPYHMFVAGADDDVSGAPEASYTQCRSIYERARGDRQLTYIHGAGHGDLLGCCGELFIDESAPGLIGREQTNRVARGYFLALAELYLRDNPAAREFFTRPFADLHPSGIGAEVVVTTEHRAGRRTVLDDFESEPAVDRSSSGGSVTADVANLAEVLMRDNDGSLAWTGSQPSNGLTHARHEGDDPHAVVFDWSPGTSRFYEQQVVDALGDFTEHEFLSMRVAQGTRHPETVALGGPLTFTVTLRDRAGTTSSIALADGAHVAPPYARDGFGAGVGWQSEFVTVRLRLAEFAVGSAIDLADIAAVRLEFGGEFGSARGRVALDDLELVPGATP